MNRIQLLPPEVYNRIAAGEVIERPASVVKELVENSIDAESSRIIVIIKQGGKKEITVIDNGIGIPIIDVPLAIQKHATSKIRNIEDLENVLTLGFRGEALAAISSVSILDIITKPETEKSGIHIRFKEGKQLYKTEVSTSTGTTVKVLNLFYNTPARLKFLKTPEKENRYIKDILIPIIISHPEIHFELIIDGTTEFLYPAQNNFFERVLAIYGYELKDQFVSILKQTDNLSISGFVSIPAVTRSSRNYQFFFVNNRPVYSKLLYSSLQEAYKSIIPPNRFPVAFIFFKANPKFIDINVHPTKKEIRFGNEFFVQNLLVSTIKEGLYKKDAVPKFIIEKARALQTEPNLSTTSPSLNTAAEITTIQPEFFKSSIRPVGQIFAEFLIVEDGNEVFLIDQHAAHERIIYERLKNDFTSRTMVSQKLLLPFTLKLTPVQYDIISKKTEILNSLGYILEEFGDTTFLVSSVPGFIRRGNDKELLLDIVDYIVEVDQKLDNAQICENTLKLIACKSAIKTGELQNIQQLSTLVEMFWKLDNKFTCPHGRPAIIKLDKTELEKKFGKC